jgi:arylsulfatase
MTLIKGKYKLHAKTDYDAEIGDFELFNLEDDPYEQKSILSGNETIAIELKKDMDKMYNELVTSENLINSPRIIVGNKKENPIILNRNDASGDRGIWAQEEIYGSWKVKIQQGNYNIRYKFLNPVKANGKMYLQTNTLIKQKQNKEETALIEMKNVYLPTMDCDLIPFYAIDSKKIFPFWVEIEKMN